MTSRFWFYLGMVIIVAGELTFLSAGNSRLQKELALINQASLKQREKSITRWLNEQSDAHKLVSLAKRLRHESPVILELIIMRAYELNPNSRDIAVLASEFDPKAKERVKFLDPLYDFDGD